MTPDRAGGLRARARARRGRCRGGGCTGPRARCSSPTRRTSRRSTACSPTVFGQRRGRGRAAGGRVGRRRRRGLDRRPLAADGRSREGDEELDVPARAGQRRGAAGGASASTRSSRGELAQLYRLMARLELATPLRRTRRHERGAPRARHRPAPQPARRACAPAASRSRSRAGSGGSSPRRLVMLCDISGSMEPYARAYLQFLVSAAGSGPHVEAFVFATRLTRAHARAGRPQPRARDPARRRGGARLVERHAHRRRAEGSSTTATAGAGWRAARSW